MSNGPIVPPADPPAPVPAPAPRVERVITGTVTCEHCGCKITRADGELVSMGDKAKEWRDADDKIDSLNRQLATAQREVQDEKAAHAVTREQLKPAKKDDWK